jgi:hypothetical protein
MDSENLTTVESLDQFLQGNQAIAFSVLGDKTERYQFTQKVLVKFTYQTCSKKDKGSILRFLMKMAAYSRQQVTRLIGQHKRKGRKAIHRKPFIDTQILEVPNLS